MTYNSQLCLFSQIIGMYDQEALLSAVSILRDVVSTCAHVRHALFLCHNHQQLTQPARSCLFRWNTWPATWWRSCLIMLVFPSPSILPSPPVLTPFDFLCLHDYHNFLCYLYQLQCQHNTCCCADYVQCINIFSAGKVKTLHISIIYIVQLTRIGQILPFDEIVSKWRRVDYKPSDYETELACASPTIILHWEIN